MGSSPMANMMSFWFWEMPDEASAAALAVAAAGGGALRTIKTTQLITATEGVEILKKAASCGDKPVTASAATPR